MYNFLIAFFFLNHVMLFSIRYRYFLVVLLAISYLSLHVNTSSANNLVEPNSDISSSIKESNIFSMPEIGLEVDLFGLYSTFRKTDFSVSGNSKQLPIIISRVLDLHRSQPALRVPFSMGNWDLEVPKITAWRGLHRSDWKMFSYTDGPEVWSNGYCNNPVYTQEKYTEAKYALFYWVGLTLDITAQNSRSLLFAPQDGSTINDVVYPDIKVIDGKKGSVFYKTTDNWKATCIDLPQGTRSGFLVTSPDGTTYKFDKFASPKSTVNTFMNWYDSLSAFVYVSQIRDIHGNTLNYEYESDSNGQLYVSSIKSNDGRDVRFEYVEMDLSQHIFWRPQGKVKFLHKVKLMADDGSTVTKEVTYNYSDELSPKTYSWYTWNSQGVWSLTSTDADFTQKGLLTEIVDPDGRKTTYKYENVKTLLERKSEYVLNHTVFDECEKWYNQYNCAPTFSTLPAKLTQIITPLGSTYTLDQAESINGGYSIISDRSIVWDNNETTVWRVKSITSYDKSTTNVEQYSFATNYFAPPGTGNAQWNDYIITTVNYPEKRKDNYTFYRSKGVTAGATWDKARFTNLFGGLLKQHDIINIDSSGNESVIYSNKNYWQLGNFVGDNSRECWILQCDKPELYTKTLVKNEVTVSGQLFKKEFYNYDSFGNVGKIIETGTKSETIEYTYKNIQNNWIIGLVDGVTLNGFLVVSNVYSDLGDLTSSTYLNQKTDFKYDSDGTLINKSWLKDGVTLSNTYKNYKRGVAQLETNAKGDSSKKTINVDGSLASQTDYEGNITSYNYNNSGLRTKTTPPIGTVSSRQWYSNNQNNIYDVTGDFIVSSDLDIHGNVIKQLTSDGAPLLNPISQYNSYDYAGRQIYTSYPSNAVDPNGKGVKRSYDAIGRILTEEETVAGKKKTFCYGSLCNVNRTNLPSVKYGYLEVDSEGYETIVNYDAYGDFNKIFPSEIIKQISKSPVKYQTTIVETNEFGKITRLIQSGLSRYFKYNSSQQLELVTEPERDPYKFTYDEVGNQKQKWSGTTLYADYTYDELNQLKSVAYHDGVSTNLNYDYFPNGNIKSISSSRSINTFKYNALGAITYESLVDVALNKEFTATYTYDSYNHLSKINYPSGVTVEYRNDAAGKPYEIYASTDYRPIMSSMIYDAYGALTSAKLGSSQTYNMIRNSNGLPEVIKYEKTSPTLESTVSLEYKYNSLGDITNIFDHNNVTNNRQFSYDGLNRLTSTSGIWGNLTYSYDDIGNIINLSRNGVITNYFYNLKNQLTFMTPNRSIQYDNNGFVTSDGVSTLTVGFDEKLAAVNNSKGAFQYFYDGNSKRYAVKNNTTTDYYFYSKNGNLLYTELGGIYGEWSNNVYVQGRLVFKISCDKNDQDQDHDGLPDCMEKRWGGSGNNPNDALLDYDNDGVSNIDEYKRNLDLTLNTDKDHDGMSDDWERYWGLNPNLAADALGDLDGDGVSNLDEYKLKTNPTKFSNWAVMSVITNYLLGR